MVIVKYIEEKNWCTWASRTPLASRANRLHIHQIVKPQTQCRRTPSSPSFPESKQNLHWMKCSEKLEHDAPTEYWPDGQQLHCIGLEKGCKGLLLIQPQQQPKARGRLQRQQMGHIQFLGMVPFYQSNLLIVSSTLSTAYMGSSTQQLRLLKLCRMAPQPWSPTSNMAILTF